MLGDLVFAVDDETMESAVLARSARQRGWTLGVAESLTGGFIGARIANVPGASRTFRGSIASYATEVKRSVLGVTAEQVVSEEAAKQMAEGAQRVLGADVGDRGHRRRRARRAGRPAGRARSGSRSRCPGHAGRGGHRPACPVDRERIRQFSTISLLNILRMRLDALALP